MKITAEHYKIMRDCIVNKAKDHYERGFISLPMAYKKNYVDTGKINPNIKDWRVAYMWSNWWTLFMLKHEWQPIIKNYEYKDSHINTALMKIFDELVKLEQELNNEEK